MTDKHDEQAEKLLPCKYPSSCANVPGHIQACPRQFAKAIAAKLREMDAEIERLKAELGAKSVEPVFDPKLTAWFSLHSRDPKINEKQNCAEWMKDTTARIAKSVTEKDDLLFASSVALIIGRSAEMVRKYERQGKLPAIKTADGTRLFRRADVEKFLKKKNAEGV